MTSQEGARRGGGGVGGDWEPLAPGIGWDGETVNMQPQGVGQKYGLNVWEKAYGMCIVHVGFRY